MLEITKKNLIFTLKQIWFADRPFDIEGVDKVVFIDCKNKVEVPGFVCKEQPTFVIDLTQDLDKIWKNIGEGNNRYAIKRAQTENVGIKINQNYEDFYELYKKVADKKGFSGLISLGDIKKYGTLFVAESKNKIISGHAYLEDADNIRSWAVGSARFDGDKVYSRLIANASRLIIWEAIKYAKAKGIKEFDFGGYYAGGMKGEILDKPNWFKQSFGGEVVKRYSYIKNYSKLYGFLSSAKQKIIG